MLNNAAVTRARSRDRAYKLADGQGLYLHVLPTSTKVWRMRYRDVERREWLGLYVICKAENRWT